MQHVTALEDLRLTSAACLTIGAFDGVHCGHQALIGEMVGRARATGRAAVVITFYPHPSVVLRGRRPAFYITTPEERAELLAALGVDAVVTHPFNPEVAAITAADFVERLVQHARLNELWCGQDFALGHNREGDVTFLRAAGERRGFTVNIVTPISLDGESVSSTRIRQALRDGAVEQVTRLLGRPFRLPGVVVEGAKRGRAIGLPTANLAVQDERAFPAVGVYACRVFHTDGVHAAVTNIGYRPTFEAAEVKPILETHLLDFSGDLYGKTLTLEFISRLRPEMKFPGVEALLAQIEKDISTARRILENGEASRQ